MLNLPMEAGLIHISSSLVFQHYRQKLLRVVLARSLPGPLEIGARSGGLSTLTGYDKLVDLGNEPAVVAETAT